MSTRVCFAVTALRMRVIMSEIGSVISVFSRLPGALRHAGHVAFERQLSEAEAAHVELAHVRARPPAQLAPVAMPDLELQRLCFLRDLCSRCHASALIRSERHAHQLQ